MEIREHVPLAPYTTFHIGGPARYFVDVATDEDLVQAITFAHEHALTVCVLGGGSNVLVADEGFSGLVIHMVNIGVEWKEDGGGVLAITSAGVGWDTFVGMCVTRGLWGLENLSGIPGHVGASPVQNIGAYGIEAEKLIAWVEVYDRAERIFRRLSHHECKFGYRNSIFKHTEGSNFIVVRVAYFLQYSGVPNIGYKDLIAYDANEKKIITLPDVREAVLAIRSRKFPGGKDIGTAGSFFKNPAVSSSMLQEFLKHFPDAPNYPQDDGTIKLSAAWIIDRVLGMRGFQMGNVGTWDEQALVLVAKRGASANEVEKLASHIIFACREKTNITLEREVVYIGTKNENI